MIRSFRHKGLERLFRHDDARGVPPQFLQRLDRLLDLLDSAERPDDMNLPGCRFHALKGERKGTYAVNVSGNWRLTFRFVDTDAFHVDLEDYH
ncbi:MAG TPA: type II toxin-antitoxin system RelE/ParE family toxin [Candidatus Acidoferrum sp.]|nr:type II toxin-antitoxin system RelE/ParE family toxin [Candidatus Acidoferrum sp.]